MTEIKQNVVVTKIPINKKMLEAMDALGNTILVDAGNNTNFALGDKIEVGPHESGYADVWRLLSAIPKDKRRLPDESVPVTQGSQPDLVD